MLARARRGRSGANGGGSQRAVARVAPAAANQPPPNYDIDAPGANDDGSGTVLTMELARVFAESGIEFDATLVFAALAGEEQGLVGARYHAEAAKKNNVPIQAVLNNDIVGNAISGQRHHGRPEHQGVFGGPGRFTLAGDRALRGEDRGALRAVASRAADGAARSVRARRRSFGIQSARIRRRRVPRGARELLEAAQRERYARRRVLSVSAAERARQCGGRGGDGARAAAPNLNSERGTPMLGRQPSGYDANMRWQASPGAVGYRIFWRDAWAHDWQHEMTVGNVTEYVMPNVSIDEYVFGIAAIGPGGHESPIAAYVYAQRRYE